MADLQKLMNIHESIAKDIGGAVLRCDTCGKKTVLVTADVARCLARGWPECCGYAMTWVTRQAGEVRVVAEKTLHMETTI